MRTELRAFIALLLLNVWNKAHSMYAFQFMFLDDGNIIFILTSSLKLLMGKRVVSDNYCLIPEHSNLVLC
jgi:hypothetical protein